MRPYTFLELTRALCSTCLAVVDAKLILQHDNVYMVKQCRNHPPEKVLVSTDYDYWRQTRQFVQWWCRGWCWRRWFGEFERIEFVRGNFIEFERIEQREFECIEQCKFERIEQCKFIEQFGWWDMRSDESGWRVQCHAALFAEAKWNAAMRRAHRVRNVIRSVYDQRAMRGGIRVHQYGKCRMLFELVHERL